MHGGSALRRPPGGDASGPCLRRIRTPACLPSDLCNTLLHICRGFTEVLLTIAMYWAHAQVLLARPYILLAPGRKGDWGGVSRGAPLGAPPSRKRKTACKHAECM